MKIGDQAQNLGIRVGAVQAVAFILLTLLGVRLYYLQIVKGDYYSERAENQRVRLIPIPAPRGAIFDRNGKLLVDSRPTYKVVLSNEALKTVNVNDRIDDYSRGLKIDRQFVVLFLPRLDQLLLERGVGHALIENRTHCRCVES